MLVDLVDADAVGSFIVLVLRVVRWICFEVGYRYVSRGCCWADYAILWSWIDFLGCEDAFVAAGLCGCCVFL